ncbi:MAG: hypothetical protein M1369_00930, partial [Deinococcus sp.]|nr:hypothetical protein [Deinococcus sp.]
EAAWVCSGAKRGDLRAGVEAGLETTSPCGPSEAWLVDPAARIFQPAASAGILWLVENPLAR